MNACLSYLLSHPSRPKSWEPSKIDLTIYPAKRQDLHGLAEVLTYSFHPPQGVNWWLFPLFKLGIYEDLCSRMNAAPHHYCCLVASQSAQTPTQSQSEIVGTVELDLRSLDIWTPRNQSPYISNLAVKLPYRRQGIARQLLLKCEQIVRDWGFDELALHVLENNHCAHQLYLSCGYQLCRTEAYLSHFIFNRPRRLLLKKAL